MPDTPWSHQTAKEAGGSSGARVTSRSVELTDEAATSASATTSNAAPREGGGMPWLNLGKSCFPGKEKTQLRVTVNMYYGAWHAS